MLFRSIRSAGTSLLPEFLPEQFSRERSVAIDKDEVITTWEGVAVALKESLAANEAGLYRRLIEHFDRIVISAAMEQTRGNQVAAAELLGISRPTLREKLKRLQNEG